MAEPQDNSWRTQSFRQNVRGKIEEAIRQSGNPTTKSVAEMENHVFQKAKSKEEYLGFVARLIIHVREMKGKGPMMVDEDSDSDSSSTTSDSEIEAYDEDDDEEDTDEDEDEFLGDMNGPSVVTGLADDQNQVSSAAVSSSRGIKRKCMEADESNSSVGLTDQQLHKWHMQVNEWEAVGINVSKKLQRMDPHQALLAETLITKVLRLGLLRSLSSETDICSRQQVLQDFVPSCSSLSQNLVNLPPTSVYVNDAHQSGGNCTLSSTTPLSGPFSVMTNSSSAFDTEQNTIVGNHSSSQSHLSPDTQNVIKIEDQNSTENNLSSVIKSPALPFKTDSILVRTG